MKREYMKPTVHVVVLQHQSQLLTVSGATQSLGSYNPEGFDLDPDGLDDDDILR